MKEAIIISDKDMAGQTIKEQLEKLKSDLKIYTVKKDSIHCENIDKEIDADIFVFSTRHASKSGIPSLTVHAQGNIGSAKFGGKENELCFAAEPYIKKCFQLLNEKKPDGFDVIQEATHHGPFIEKPCFFIELGSDENEWKNKDGGKAIAETIIECFSQPIQKYKTAIGIGGMHHSPNFAKIMKGNEYAISHVCAKYNLEFLDENILNQMINRSMQPAEKIFLDWKGLGEHKEKVKQLVEKSGIDWEKV
ncbi:MAG TPA: D-aminoacyl-tRNA deacylase [Candidatus Nanoarchaeia archaeon]|nr:D-aminoacyl-tRNA deacylase [Candidatus Nanoarchaeia archaeon]